MALAWFLSKSIPIFAHGWPKCTRQALHSVVQHTSKPKPISGVATAIQPLQNVTTRFSSSRKKCMPDPFPMCRPENIAKTPCMKEKKANKPHNSPFKDLLWNQECCDSLCPATTRFDHMYYQPSDKLKRKYTRTWAECRDPYKKKPVCEIGKIIPPTIKKRKFKSRKRTGCNDAIKPKDLMDCRKKKFDLCPKITLKGCKGARAQPKCLKERRPMDCEKVCAPYPSFSECIRKRPRKLRKRECDCLRPRMICEAYMVLAKMKPRKESEC